MKKPKILIILIAVFFINESILCNVEIVENPEFNTEDQVFKQFEGNFNVPRGSTIPPLNYSALIGAGGWDDGYSICVDSEGYAYIAGNTISDNFPTTPEGIINYNNGEVDFFICKIGKDGTSFEYSVKIGGSGEDWVRSMVIDSNGSVYVTGFTNSYNFPLTNDSLDNVFDEKGDIFICKLNPEGTSLEYSTLFGGSDADDSTDIDIDSDNCIYITGTTTSVDFPCSDGAYSNFSSGIETVFVSKIDYFNSVVVYSTLLEKGVAKSIAVNSYNQAWITGNTYIHNFPTTQNGYNKYYMGGYYDGFITQINENGSSLIYSSYIGGNGHDEGESLVLDSSDNIFITGYTASSNFASSPDAVNKTIQNWPGFFVWKINQSNYKLTYSLFISGGISSDIDVDSQGNVYITGTTDTDKFYITWGALNKKFRRDFMAFACKINSNGSSILYSTFLGGGVGFSIKSHTDGYCYITGYTSVSTFPTTAGSIGETYNGGETDVFICKIRMINVYIPPLSPIEISLIIIASLIVLSTFLFLYIKKVHPQLILKIIQMQIQNSINLMKKKAYEEAHMNLLNLKLKTSSNESSVDNSRVVNLLKRSSINRRIFEKLKYYRNSIEKNEGELMYNDILETIMEINSEDNKDWIDNDFKSELMEILKKIPKPKEPYDN